MKYLKWLKAHWYLPLFVVGSIIGVIVGALLQRKGQVGPQTLLKEELAAIKESSRISDILAKDGHKAAMDAVGDQHYELVKILDTDSAEKAKRLADDPVALSRHLERVGKRLRR